MLRNLMSLFIKKVFSLYNPVEFLAILYPNSLANLLDEVGTRQSPDPIDIQISET